MRRAPRPASRARRVRRHPCTDAETRDAPECADSRGPRAAWYRDAATQRCARVYLQASTTDASRSCDDARTGVAAPASDARVPQRRCDVKAWVLAAWIGPWTGRRFHQDRSACGRAFRQSGQQPGWGKRAMKIGTVLGTNAEAARRAGAFRNRRRDSSPGSSVEQTQTQNNSDHDANSRHSLHPCPAAHSCPRAPGRKPVAPHRATDHPPRAAKTIARTHASSALRPPRLRSAAAPSRTRANALAASLRRPGSPAPPPRISSATRASPRARRPPSCSPS